MTTPEIDAVRQWLAKEGYPLEYETSRQIASAGFRSWQGRYYRDPNTGEAREIDVRASEPDRPGPIWHRVEVVAECKNNGKPWLVLTESIELGPGYGCHFLIQKNVDIHALADRVDVDNAFLLNTPARHGYSAVQAFAGPDTPWAAMHAVVKAAQQAIRPSAPPQRAIAIPIVVVGGSLYQLGFDASGTEILEAVAWQRVVWHGWLQRDAVDTQPVQIDFVTREYLPHYLRDLRRATRSLASVLERLPSTR